VVRSIGVIQLAPEAKAVKNARIKATQAETRTRRKSMTTKVYHLKIVENKITEQQAEALYRIFLETKWLRNAALADQDFDTNYAKKHGYLVFVKKGAWLEQRPLVTLGSQMAQSVVQGLRNDLAALKSSKAKGRKVGRLKFTRQVNSVDLKQYGTTWDINPALQKIRVQGVKGWLRVRGIKQIPKNVEYANAKLLKKPDGYYLAVTCYVPPAPERFVPDTRIGVDFNVGRPIVLSDGREFAVMVKETDRLKRLQRKRSRQKKGSNNYIKTCALIQKQYQKIENIKTDTANKIVAELLNYEHIFVQDENISVWKRKDSPAHGSVKIHHGILGKVKAKLVNHPRVTVLPRNIPTTAWCRKCHNTTKHPLGKNTYNCEYCGYHHHDRDKYAAENMILIGRNLATYRFPWNAGLKPVENKTSTIAKKGEWSMTTHPERKQALSNEAGNGVALAAP